METDKRIYHKLMPKIKDIKDNLHLLLYFLILNFLDTINKWFR